VTEPFTERRRAVYNGTINFLSVSSVTMFDPSQDGGCNRAWFFRYVEGIKKPENVQGVDIHKQIEHYYKTGEDVLTPIVRAGKHFMPARGEDLLIEHKIDESSRALTARGIPFRLSIDLAHSRGTFIDSTGEVKQDRPKTAEVIDWKSIADIAKYAKRGPQLIDTIQMAGYGETIRRADPSLDYARLSHVYFQTRGRKHSEKRTALFLIETVKDRWQGVENVVDQMVDVAKEVDAMRVDPNWDSCGAYGGCFYRERCPRSPDRVILDLFGKGKGMSLLKTLQAQTGLTGLPSQAAGTAPPPSPPPGFREAAPASTTPQLVQMSTAANTVPTAPPGVQTPDMAARRAAIEAQMAALQMEEAAAMNRTPPAPIQPATSSPTCPLCLEPFTVQNVSRLPDGTLFHVGCPKRSGVNPPDAARSLPHTAAMPVPVEVIPTLPPAVAAAAQAHAQAVALANAGHAQPQAVATMGAMQTPAPPAAAPEKPARKRTRKPAQTPSAEAGPASESGGSGIVLFTDVVPVKGLSLQSLEDYIEDICDQICEASGASDIRFAHEQSAISFGKWRGALAAAVKSAPPPAGNYLISYAGESEIKQVVVEALTSIADVVVRGR
jgi:hypothetical protein